LKFLSKRYRGILCGAVAGGILSVLAGCGDTATPTIVSQSVPTAAPSQEPLATMAVDTTSESTPSMRSTKVHATSESTIRYILQSSVEPFYSFGEITLGPLPGPDGSYFAGTIVTLTALLPTAGPAIAILIGVFQHGLGTFKGPSRALKSPWTRTRR